MDIRRNYCFETKKAPKWKGEIWKHRVDISAAQIPITVSDLEPILMPSAHSWGCSYNKRPPGKFAENNSSGWENQLFEFRSQKEVWRKVSNTRQELSCSSVCDAVRIIANLCYLCHSGTGSLLKGTFFFYPLLSPLSSQKLWKKKFGLLLSQILKVL